MVVHKDIVEFLRNPFRNPFQGIGAPTVPGPPLPAPTGDRRTPTRPDDFNDSVPSGSTGARRILMTLPDGTVLYFDEWDEFVGTLEDYRGYTGGLNDPQTILAAILLGNMIVNVAFYALSFLITLKLAQISAAAGALSGAIALLVVILLGEVSRYFQEGYTGLGRDEGVFLFAQQRAVFITPFSTKVFTRRSMTSFSRDLLYIGSLSRNLHALACSAKSAL